MDGRGATIAFENAVSIRSNRPWEGAFPRSSHDSQGAFASPERMPSESVSVSVVKGGCARKITSPVIVFLPGSFRLLRSSALPFVLPLIGIPGAKHKKSPPCLLCETVLTLQLECDKVARPGPGAGVLLLYYLHTASTIMRTGPLMMQ